MKKTLLPGLCALLAAAGTSYAQTTAFTYQGRLNSGAAVANGSYDLTFALFSVSSGAGQVGITITNSPVAMSNGLFTVMLDFGTNFPGADRWLEIGVRSNGVGSFLTLAPRQPLTSTPYAIRALLAGTATTANSVAAGVVNNTAIASGAVDSAKVADGSIAAADLSPTVLSNTFWRLPGNAGTLPGVNFLGTTDNQSLEFKVNGARAWRLEPNATSPNVLGGFSGNIVSNGVVGAVIAGGGQLNNSNRVGGSFSTVGGGYNNLAYFGSATVAGGDNNRAAQDRATVSGGFSNRATGLLSTVGGGDVNLASGQAATVPGGSFNEAGASYAFAAGRRAKATNQGAFVWADSQNADFASTANNQFLIRAAGGVGIGTTNPAAALDVAGTARATMFAGNGGGLTNLNAATLGGIAISNLWSLGGNANTTPGVNFLGTTDNQPLELKAKGQRAMRLEPSDDGYPNVIGGASDNIANNPSSALFIGGGHANNIGTDAFGGVIGGGQGNVLYSQSSCSTIGGGRTNKAGGLTSTISGGLNNTVADFTDHATIGGGSGNNIASQSPYATIPGGVNNTATNYAFAAGRRAKAIHTGAFVWADSTDTDVSSTAANQFLIRASGGVGVGLNNPAAQLEVSSGGGDSFPQARINQTNDADYARLRFTVSGDYSKRWDLGSRSNAFVIYSGQTGSEALRLENNNAYVNGALVLTSDRNAKENFRPVDSRAVLDKVVALPLQEWNYRTDAERSRHVGPMAQDFRAAFGLGTDDKHIATVDADGVALAAIQGLNQKLEEKEKELASLKTRLEKLEQLINR